MREFVVDKGSGRCIVAAIIAVVLLISTTFACQNLLSKIAVFPSVLWILLVTFVVLSDIKASGLRGYLLGILGGFSRRQFLQVVETSAGEKALNAGFTLWRLRLVEHRIRANDIVEVDWRSGQASDMARRDVGDWSVFLRFRHGNASLEAKRQERHYHRPEQTVVVLGPPRPRVDAESLASDILVFLRESGALTDSTASSPPDQPAAPDAGSVMLL